MAGGIGGGGGGEGNVKLQTRAITEITEFITQHIVLSQSTIPSSY